jgi:hypothetical protein
VANPSAIRVANLPAPRATTSRPAPRQRASRGVESDVYENAQDVLKTGKPKLLSYGIADEEAWEVGLPCGGEIDVFVEPLE